MALIESGQGAAQDGVLPLQAGINYLTNAQLPNGSWNDDPYSTALALQALAAARPNLSLSSVAFSKSMPLENENITITATVRNTGLETASGAVVRFFQGDPAAGGVQIGTDQTISSLAVNSTASSAVTASFTGTGSKTIYAVVDPDGIIPESSKTDNKLSNRLWIATGPDLAVFPDDLKPSTYTPRTDEMFNFEYKVRNLGETAADAFTVSLYDGDPTSGGVLLKTANLSGLNGSEFRIGNFSLSFPGFGEHRLYLVADSDNQIVTETSKANNTSSIKIYVNGEFVYADVLVSPHDVAVTPARPHAGETVQISAIVKNQGAAGADNFQVEIFDGAPESGGTLIASQLMSLAVGTEQTLSTTWTMPSGIHDIYIIADRRNDVLETEKINNRVQTRIMADMIDISVSATDMALTPSHPVASDAVALTIAAKNLGIMGTGAFNLALYDGDPDAGGVLLQNYPVSNLAADGSVTLSYAFTATPKTYRFYAVADREGIVTELYESNNTAVRSLKVLGTGETLGPDLVPVKIDLTDTTTDPQTLAITGTAHVTFQNQGDAKITTPFDVAVFEDRDGDGRYTQGIDALLSTGTTSVQLWPEGAGMIDLPLTGTVTFLHSPLYAFIDSGDSILEQSEGNNYLASCKDCVVAPPNTIQTAVKWRFTQPPQAVVQLPVVAPLIDTNGDGRIDESDVPAILFTQPSPTYPGDPGFVRALRGDTGQEIWSVTRTDIHSGSFIAVGDLDNDGKPEILLPDRLNQGILALNSNGTFSWNNVQSAKDWCTAKYRYTLCTTMDASSSPLIANLDGGTTPQIIMGANVMNFDGSMRWTNFGKSTGTGYQFGGQHVIAADIDLDGKQEILAGNTVYRSEDGSVMWPKTSTSLKDGVVAVGNFNADPYPEIVHVTSTTENPYVHGGARITMLDHLGNIIWGPVYIYDFEPSLTGSGGHPVIADVDGDGYPEIILKGMTHIIVLDRNGKLKWSYTVNYITNGLGSPVTVFDLDGDGVQEVLVNGNGNFLILNGKDGTLRHSEPFFASSNNLPSILVADIDGDGHAEALLTGGSSAGDLLTVIGEKNNTWVNTRRVWNQLAYHETNVNDDGSIPVHETPSWLVNNSYRTQAAVGSSPNPYLTPNMTASYLRIDQAGPSTNLAVRIGNGGAKNAAAGVKVEFYDGDPAGHVLIGTATTSRVLQPGEYEDVGYTWIGGSLGLHHIYAVVNECAGGVGCISECRSDDNRATRDVTIATAYADLQVVSEDILLPAGTVTEGSVIPVTVTVRNLGELSAANVSVKLFNGSPASGGYQIGATQNVPFIGAATATQMAFTFDTLGKSGSNVLYAVIDQENSILESNESNNIAQVVVNVQAPTLPNLVVNVSDITVAPATAQEGEPATVTATITNRGAAVGNIPVRLTVDSQEVSTQAIYPVLGLGQTATVTFTLNTVGLAGQRNVAVAVDPANTITESSKSDNSAEKVLTVQSAGMVAAAVLDKATYQANENMTALITATDFLGIPRVLGLTVLVKDSVGNVVSTISSSEPLSLGPNASLTMNKTWNAGNTLSGGYMVYAEIAESGRIIAKTNTAFTIAPDKTISSKVVVDKISYNPNDMAAMTATVTSGSANYAFENLTAQVTVAGAAGSIYSEIKSITGLMPGASSTFKSYWTTGTYPANTYPVSLEVKDSTGAVIASANSSIVISNIIKPTTALRGQVSVDKQSLMAGEPVNVTYNVLNIGNIDLSAVNLSVKTVHVKNTTVYDTIASQTTLTMGGFYASTGSVNTTQYSAMDYLVVLQASVNGGTEETLAGTFFRVEGAPTTPSLALPADGTDVLTQLPALSVNNASDPNDDKLTYEFELYGDSSLTQILAAGAGIVPGAGITEWQVPAGLTENSRYYWRSRAYDGKLYGEWMPLASFRVNMANDLPGAPVVSSPADNTEVSALTPLLTVTNAADPDTTGLTYNFDVALDPDFTQIVATTVGVAEGQGATSWQVSAGLSENTWYYWRSQADDWLGTGPWSTPARFFVNTVNNAPSVPVILSPASNAVVTTIDSDISLQNSTDPDSPVISYYFEIDRVPTFDSGSLIRSGIIPAGAGTTTWRAIGLLDNTQYYVRAMASDGSAGSGWTSGVGFFVNTTNDAPTTPAIANPSNGSGVTTATPTLTVHNSTDLDRDPLTYEFAVYSDSALTNLVATAIVPETPGTTSWTVPVTLTENSTYWWSCRASDGALTSGLVQASFMVNTANDAPTMPVVLSPLNSSTIDTLTPTLTVGNSTDSDSTLLTYDFEVYAGTTMVWSAYGVAEGTGTTSVILAPALADNTAYSWRARANDGNSTSAWTVQTAFTTHVSQAAIKVEIEVEPETLNQKSKGNWVMVEIELPHGYRASDVDISSIRLEGTVPAVARPYGIEKRHHDHGCESDRTEHDHSELKVKFDRNAVINILPAGDKVPVRVTGMIGTTAFEGADIIRVIK